MKIFEIKSKDKKQFFDIDKIEIVSLDNDILTIYFENNYLKITECPNGIYEEIMNKCNNKRRKNESSFN